ncbi:MAG TPA: sigma-70 family RNA polymerase sigma factor [Chthoniobacteraceae bacterium]|nr:sigma-70 family RNA polymerase sigma factor [Chthoniobacteraceae bacterium]
MSAEDAWLTRETLLQRVRRQYDQVAWEEFMFYYRGYVYNIACRMGLNHHDAEEVVQTVMVQLWKKLPEFEYDSRKGRFRGWLCTVAGNEVKMLLRRKSRDIERLSPAEKEDLIQHLHKVETPSEELAEQEWVQYITTMAWSRVQEEFGANEKAAFEMVSKGIGVDEVSKKLGITTSSVYVYKKRVTDRLKQEIIRLNNDLD